MRIARLEHSCASTAHLVATVAVFPSASARPCYRPAACTGWGWHSRTDCHQQPDSSTAANSLTPVGNRLVDLYPPSKVYSKRIPFLMASKKDGQALTLADTRVPRSARKASRLRGFSAPPPGLLWPMTRPGQPGSNFGQRRPIQGPMPPQHGAELGPPLDIKDVARMIGCSPWSIRQTLIPRGLPHFRFTANGRLIFYGNQVTRWIENQQQGGQRQK